MRATTWPEVRRGTCRNLSWIRSTDPIQALSEVTMSRSALDRSLIQATSSQRSQAAAWRASYSPSHMP